MKLLRLTRPILALSLLSAAAPSHAASPGEEVIVIYNTRVPESREVAEYYAKRRQVPPQNLFGFPLSTGEEMQRKEFDESLRKPLAKAIEDKKLWRTVSTRIPATNGQPAQTVRTVAESNLRYAVVCYGVPTKIIDNPAIKEPVAETMRPELRRNGAAVDSELALLPRIAPEFPITGPLTSPFYASTNAAVFHSTNGLLMVTRLDGPSASLARGLVDKAIEAETTGLWGRAYFDLRNISTPGLKVGEDWIRTASELCRYLGYETVVDTNAATFLPEFPMSQAAVYAGWYDEDVSGPFAHKMVEFMPGAFAYHLHSFSAVHLRSATNRWVGPLIATGATISMGCVDEPYLVGTPDISVFVGRLLYLGFSFGEAAYASQSVLSWQITFVGDPLYRPVHRNPQAVHAELERTRGKALEWSYLRLMNINLANGAPITEITAFLEQLELTRQSAVLTEKLGDLYAALGKPSSAMETYEKALTRGPSPIQRIRLRLAIGQKLTALDRKRDLYDNWQKFREESPAYPAKFNILKSQLNIGTQLGDSNLITRAVNAMLEWNKEQASRKE